MTTVVDLGTLIGQRFIIEAKAGQGGMGAVYRARDILRGDTVAIKLLHRNVDSFDETERFAREVQILAELCHPGIVSYVSHGVLGHGQPYLVMEWLKGEELTQRLRRRPLSPSESLLLIKHVAEALDVAHQRQIVHRDLKPSNLFLRSSELEQVTILDFGIARRSLHATSVTRTGLVIGTPEYMAPEQARGQRDIDASADIFSLGCVLFECLTGQPPFTSDCARKNRGLRGGRSRTTKTQRRDPAGERPDRLKPSQRAGSESCVSKGNLNTKRRQRVNGLWD